MKIKKNGKVISLTESDLQRIVRRVIQEQGIDADALRSAEPTMMEYFQFNLDYFKKNPRGTIKMDPNKTFPSLLKINEIEVKNNSNFNDHWNADGPDFGRAFRTGNGMFNYEWDGSQLNIVGGSGNEKNCRPDYCYYKPE